MAQQLYRAIAHRAPGDGPEDGWDVLFPDFPGCASRGETAIEALKNAIEALSLHLEGMTAEGQSLPPDSQPDAPDPAWVTEIEMQDRVDALLNVVVPGKRVRIDVTMDRALLDRLDSAAAREGATRSGYLTQAVREKLQRSREPA